MACFEVELHNNAIKSDASQASGDVSSCGAATRNEVLSEDQRTVKIQSAASQMSSVHSVGRMPEDTVGNEVQPQFDAIRTDASQSHVALASSGSKAPVTDCLAEKSDGNSKGECVEQTETNSKDGSSMEVPIGALEVTSSGNLNKGGDAERKASSRLNGVLLTSSELIPCPNIKEEVYLGSDGSGKVGFNLGSTQTLSESVSIKTDVEQLQTEDLSLDDSFVSKAESASIEHLADGTLRKEQEKVDTTEEETVVSPAVGTDNQNMKGITFSASPSTGAEALVDESPLCGSYKPAKDKLEVAPEETHADMAEVCGLDRSSVNASLKTTKDLSSAEKEKYRIPETFEKQVNVADSLTEKCGSDLAAQGPDMKDSDISEVALSPKSQSSFLVGTSQSEPEGQAIAEANLDPGISCRDYSLSSLDNESDKEFEKQNQIYSSTTEICETDMIPVNFVETFPSTESGAQKESLSPRLASNAEAIEALTEKLSSRHDTNYVAELQGNLSSVVKDDLSNSEATVSQLCPAAGSSGNHPELKQVVVKDMRTEICEESASDGVDDIEPQQTEKADSQCRGDLSVETHDSKISEGNVDVLNSELNKPLSSTIAGTSQKVADLELVAEENTRRISDGLVDSGQVAEKSEHMAIRDLTVEGRESKGTDTSGDISTLKNGVESQSSVVENIEKMYNKSVASGKVITTEPLIERSDHLHVLDRAIEVQGNKGFDATKCVSISNSELNEAQPGGTSQIGTDMQFIAEEDPKIMNKENTLPDATAVEPQPAMSENLSIQDPENQLPKNQQSDATEDFLTSNSELNESQLKAADETDEIAVDSHLVPKQNMEICVDVAIGDDTAKNAAVGKSENFPSIGVSLEEKGKKESDVTDEISNSELSDPKTSQSTIEVKTPLICEKSGMTVKEVASLEVEVVETPFRDMPGGYGRDFTVDGQEKEKSAASKNVANPQNEEPKCSPGARAAGDGAESQSVAESDSKTVLTKEDFSGMGSVDLKFLIVHHQILLVASSNCFSSRLIDFFPASGKEEKFSIWPAGDEDVPTASEYADQELSSATGAGDKTGHGNY
ncbi:hypothetical protein T459_28105 [Capsicum annuum]|uniref:Uncharacterized protein n=1 Tax=Capsicum annuum TaxID=4072 RepID=A0A2G2YFT8_CAPAN|nr:hypothetical protein T459_28105 [Capsicum annuum]